MGQDQAAEGWNFQCIAIGLRLLVGPGEQDERLGAARLPVAFHGGHLDRLMVEGVEAVEIAEDELQRHQDKRHPQPDREAGARAFEMLPPPHMQAGHADDQERAGDIGGDDHVGEPIGKRRIEDRGAPACELEFTVRKREPGRRLHPAVGRQDPEGADHRARRHHEAGQDVQARRDPVGAEQHDADEARLQKEGHQHLIGEERADHIAGALGKDAPVGADLVGEHDPGHHPHGEAEREQVNPEAHERPVDRTPSAQPQDAEDDDEAGYADAVGRPQDVIADRERELRAGDQQAVESHRGPLDSGPRSCHSPDLCATAAWSWAALFAAELSGAWIAEARMAGGAQ